ncbi:MAG: CDC48 family AAA ATPase [Candidatus Brockarchaeota archaeon]|nr:CDC48 family AAA ATPase [Candidatus Brockarchaeota archaeon]
MSIPLTVVEARPEDSLKRVARIGRRAMAQLNIRMGDVILIKGRKSASAIAWPSLGEDGDRNVIRMDYLLRKSVGVAIGEQVLIEKVEKVSNGLEVTLSMEGMRAEKIEQKFIDYVKNKFLNMPLMEGDFLSIPIFGGGSFVFKVVKTRPQGVVRMIGDTRLQIVSETVAERYAIARVSYDDIGGLHDEVRRVREMVELPLRHPEVFQRLGIEPPKGILLYGPPGCGKTLLAKAVANEVNATFISISGPEIMGKYYGESEERLRQVFKEAQENAPSIIFIDEIDAIAPKRSEVQEVERRVVAQLLALMDGLKARGDIIVMAATNMPELIDPALRRPGRFDREIEIRVPNKDGRLEILQIHTRGVPLANDVDLEKIAEITYGYSGADLALLCKEAAMKVLRRNLPSIESLDEGVPTEVLEKLIVTPNDFMEAYREITPTVMREVSVEVPVVHWDDVGGLEDVKRMLIESIVEPIKHPEAFKELGIEPPKGILLYGPPGCGKTLLAKAIATESGANFISIRGPEVFSKWVGESEKTIREVFRKARMASPAIVFLDEIESIAPSEILDESGVSKRVVSQLLTEIDGLIPLQNVIVIGATNKPWEVDPSVLRPGRLEKSIYVPPPDEDSRLQILKIVTRKMPLEEDVDLMRISKITEGFSGADLQYLCKEAGMNAYRRRAKKVGNRDFEEALRYVFPSIGDVHMYEEWRKNK